MTDRRKSLLVPSRCIYVQRVAKLAILPFQRSCFSLSLIEFFLQDLSVMLQACHSLNKLLVRVLELLLLQENICSLLAAFLRTHLDAL